MKIIYQAADIVEAHIIAGMLQAHDIEAFVGGHYLQGAVGDLAIHGLAIVSVHEKDVAAAQGLISEYENNTAADQTEPASDHAGDGLPWFA